MSTAPRMVTISATLCPMQEAARLVRLINRVERVRGSARGWVFRWKPRKIPVRLWRIRSGHKLHPPEREPGTGPFRFEFRRLASPRSACLRIRTLCHVARTNQITIVRTPCHPMGISNSKRSYLRRAQPDGCHKEYLKHAASSGRGKAIACSKDNTNSFATSEEFRCW